MLELTRKNLLRLVGLIAGVALLAVVAGCNPMNLSSRSNLPWMTDYEAARAKAREENKLLLINFTGSDWCGWCKRLQSEVFSKPIFAQYARANLVLLEVDFPRSKTLRAEQIRANEALSQRFQVQGFPTIHVLDSSGRPLGSTGYVPGGPEVFIKEIKRLANARSTPLDNADASGDELRLTGISGVPGSRLAMINNTTVAAGETSAVRTSKGRVQIRCIAILNDSVVVSVNGNPEPVELHLSGRL